MGKNYLFNNLYKLQTSVVDKVGKEVEKFLLPVVMDFLQDKELQCLKVIAYL